MIIFLVSLGNKRIFFWILPQELDQIELRNSSGKKIKKESVFVLYVIEFKAFVIVVYFLSFCKYTKKIRTDKK